MKFPEMVIISRRRDKLFRGFRIGAKGTSVVLAPRHLGAHAMHVRLGVGVFPYVVVGVEEEVRFVIRHPLHVRPRYVAPVGDPADLSSRLHRHPPGPGYLPEGASWSRSCMTSLALIFLAMFAVFFPLRLHGGSD